MAKEQVPAWLDGWSAVADGGTAAALAAVASTSRRMVRSGSGSIDLDEVARQIEMGGERFRQLADSTGRWIGERLGDPAADHSAGARGTEPGTAPTTGPVAGPYPLDVPSDAQGRALSAIDSGRWKVAPGTDELVAEGDEASPTDLGGLVGELRARDWIAANGEVTLIGREALKRRSDRSPSGEDV